MHKDNHNHRFIIQGGHPLNGEITVSGSKNAALPILCATLLANTSSTLTNVPDIADIHSLLNIFNHLGVKTNFTQNTVTVDPSGFKNNKIPDDLVCTMRASILLLGPLLGRFKEADLPFPGGCVLGKRPVHAHTHALQQLGAKIINETEKLHLKITQSTAANIILPESSVTATENALMLAAITPGITTISLAAAEPHVADLCHFLNKMGTKIEGINTHTLTVHGQEKLHGALHNITGDYLEAGTFAIAGLLTKGNLLIKGIETDQLASFFQKLDEIGANYRLTKDTIHILPTQKFNAIPMLRTAIHPSFATDLQAPFSVLLTQAEGESKVFETLFDGRLQYLYELEKMGAKVQILNPYQAIIKGPTPLKGAAVASCDIRAGAAMVLAALCAKGETEISAVRYIDRGYENLEQKLSSLGAKIERL